jgi:Xaa-Pro aminopeptidase
MVTQPATKGSTPVAPLAQRLDRLRAHLRAADLDAMIVRSTDRWLNEYVPVAESTRAYVTGFSGSVGDALVTADSARLFIDGRYTLQAKREAEAFSVQTVELGVPIETAWLEALASVAGGARGGRVGVETERLPVSLMRQLKARAEELGLEVVALRPSPLEQLMTDEGVRPRKKRGKVRAVDAALTGQTVRARLAQLAPAFDAAGVDGFVVVPLDEIAWLANLRGDHFPYQATFRAQAVALAEDLYIAADPRALQGGAELDDGVHLVGEDGMGKALDELRGRKGELKLGFSVSGTPEAVRADVEAAGIELVEMDAPYALLRTQKNASELAHMAECFARADEVVKKLQRWLNPRVSSGEHVTEADVEKKVRQLFKRSGANGLSFAVIPAAGKNGAQIHYSSPDADSPLREGDLFLLDTGAYYEGGYATDLTRTFLLGKKHITASDEQKRLFTYVLKAAIAGMSVRFPRGTTGEQLDAMVRAPMWSAGLDYGHGTGHGVGVNVHEFPPRVTRGVHSSIEPGQVFSIEPGVYLPDFGGVRIENLVVCEEDQDHSGYLRIRPLTFSPLDKRLIDGALLDAHEKSFLRWFTAGEKLSAEERLGRELPPLRHG